jgi:hypothetical protein
MKYKQSPRVYLMLYWGLKFNTTTTRSKASRHTLQHRRLWYPVPHWRVRSVYSTISGLRGRYRKWEGLGGLRSASDKSFLICKPTSASPYSVHQFKIHIGVSNLSYKIRNAQNYHGYKEKTRYNSEVEAFTMINMNITLFRNVTPCILTGWSQCF